MNYLQKYTQLIANSEKFILISRILLLIFFIYTVLQSAWIGDDARITFRQVWNLVNNDGITFNFGERVQAFTHPIWFLLLSSVVFITKEIFYTSIFINIGLSVFAIFIMLKMEKKLSNDNMPILSPVMFLLFSWAFIDYMTSGLENPLSYFLISILLYKLSTENWKERYKEIFVILSLLVLNRFDYVVLFFPLAVYLLFCSRNISYFVKSIIPGSVILVLWFAFATFYFGSPLPNTFYAKLNAGYPIDQMILRGKEYFLALRQDPVTAIILISGILSAIISLNRLLLAIALGQIAYMGYILIAGGDFMQGRYFAALTFISTGEIVIASAMFQKFSIFQKNIISFSALIVVIIIGSNYGYPFDAGYSPRESVFQFEDDLVTYKMIHDERGSHYRNSGLLSKYRKSWGKLQDQSETIPDQYQTTCGELGIKSQREQSIYLIDLCALSDPFLSRIPAVKIEFWVIGHHFRKLPMDYGEYLIGNISKLPDDSLNNLLSDITLLTRGNLSDPSRLAAIWRVNSGYYSNIDFSNYTNEDVWIPKTSKEEVQIIESWSIDFQARIFNNNLKLISKNETPASAILLDLDSGYYYDVYVNEKFITNLFQPKFGAYQIIDLPVPTKVKSIKIEAVNSIYRDWAGYNIIWNIDVPVGQHRLLLSE